MNNQQQIILKLTEVSNLLRSTDGRLSISDPALVFDHSFDPRIDVDVYDRRSLEEQVISIGSFDPETHLLKSGGKYFYAVDFATTLR